MRALRVNLKPPRENGSTVGEGRVDVAAWLRGLGLEQYEPAFRDHGIDAEILPKLTVEDLKDVRVTRVGDSPKAPRSYCGASRRRSAIARGRGAGR